jgi:hypothetical protein
MGLVVQGGERFALCQNVPTHAFGMNGNPALIPVFMDEAHSVWMEHLA